MQSFFVAWLLAAIPVLAAPLEPHASCPPPAKTYGTSQIILYSRSDSCKGNGTTRTIAGPGINKDHIVYSKCYVATKPFNSFELHHTSQGIVQNCNIAWYDNESCAGSDNEGSSSAYAGVCRDAKIVVFNEPTMPSKSFILSC